MLESLYRESYLVYIICVCVRVCMSIYFPSLGFFSACFHFLLSLCCPKRLICEFASAELLCLLASGCVWPMEDMNRSMAHRNRRRLTHLFHPPLNTVPGQGPAIGSDYVGHCSFTKSHDFHWKTLLN